jgi:hypothetical protein
VLQWLSTKQLHQFASEVVAEFALSYPPEMAKGEEDRKSEQRRINATRDLYRAVTAFQGEHRLWLYTKAKLCKSIQNQLNRRDYPEHVVSKLADDLVMRITAGIKRPF